MAMKRLSKERAIQLLKERIRGLRTVRGTALFGPNFEKWKRGTEVTIENVFGQNTRHTKDFLKVPYSLAVRSSSTKETEREAAYQKGLDHAESLLESFIEEIETYWQEESVAQLFTEEPTESAAISDNVFIIHGHDDGLKETVARFVSKLGLNPVILHEQPDQGRTIIEKVERHAEVAYAIALLSPDDLCTTCKDTGSLKPRPRQNVLFEFGFFIGRLGRERVSAITKGDLEMPSDYIGVLYIPYDDSGAWRMQLVRELKAAGLNVDANLAL